MRVSIFSELTVKDYARAPTRTFMLLAHTLTLNLDRPARSCR